MVYLSAKTGEGLEFLRRKLLALAGWEPATEGSYMARERHLHALIRVQQHISQAIVTLTAGNPPVEVGILDFSRGQVVEKDIRGRLLSRRVCC